jgi:hypothetical protein
MLRVSRKLVTSIWTLSLLPNYSNGVSRRVAAV